MTIKPQLVAVRNESLVDELKEVLGDFEEKPEIIHGEHGIIEVARHLDDASFVTGVKAHTHALRGGSVTGRSADVIVATNTAVEVALRLVRLGKKSNLLLS
ncbi:hypothetical protein K2173_019326 [Erythroxylum novogranatense]|uniref:1-deoxy-D-xylulose 5-phosphate reductoisomerase N-terminal domain-containing protein n=1 Tax=Erythroxylum novogranatense TaxID=1862640 RepID=A0AAV8SU01_9ROSI|nr:hypothetical protein K2173_019326 [Erythroxylum novogranatense]